MKKIPYAVANYEKIVDENFYFVDKTRYIHELEKYQVPVFLRPRRFGKSLWCSILECYYDINRADRFEELFGNTDIGRDPSPMRSRHLVLRFDFSVIQVEKNIKSIEASFNLACRDAIRVFAAEYRNWTDFSGISNLPSATDALRSIMAEVRLKKCPPLHIIIDEYDNFTNQLLTAREDRLYGELTTGDSFLRSFYKVIKAGIGEGSVARVFITGVLPVTMDDLTSGFNIGEIVTLKEHLLSMLGFTQAEVDRYVDDIFLDHGWDERLKEQVRAELRTHYNGYRFLPGAVEPLYNSTILTYYLKHLVVDEGKIPEQKIDDNIKIDVNWLNRLTGCEAETLNLLSTLVFNGEIPVDLTMLREKFSMQQFFQREFYPLSLFYLGMATFKEQFTLGFPNLTVKTIFISYFNTMERISVSEGYTDMFRQFLQDGDWERLFAGYHERYLGQIPAQAFDKINENFIRTTFYELCNRYLSHVFMFAIEVNLPSGRSDWQAVGRPGSRFENQAWLIEFKHFPEKDKKKVAAKKQAAVEDVLQVSGYAEDLQRQFPWLSVKRQVCYTIGHTSFKFFNLD